MPKNRAPLSQILPSFSFPLSGSAGAAPGAASLGHGAGATAPEEVAHPQPGTGEVKFYCQRIILIKKRF